MFRSHLVQPGRQFVFVHRILEGHIDRPVGLVEHLAEEGPPEADPFAVGPASATMELTSTSKSTSLGMQDDALIVEVRRYRLLKSLVHRVRNVFQRVSLQRHAAKSYTARQGPWS